MSSSPSNIKKKAAHRYREGAGYLSYFMKPMTTDPVRLVIFAQGRTGSTLLESLLCSTRHFRRNGELLKARHGEIMHPIQYILGRSKIKAHENFIFHVKINQLTEDRKRPVDPVAFLETLCENGWRVIYLRRANKVRHALSNIVAQQRGRYHKYNDNKEELKVHVNCEELVRRVEDRFRREKAEREVLANIKYHEVVYEEDLEEPASHQKTVDRVLNFVSLESRVASTWLEKINTQSLEDLIVNYDEFVAQLRKREWLKFLEE